MARLGKRRTSPTAPKDLQEIAGGQIGIVISSTFRRTSKPLRRLEEVISSSTRLAKHFSDERRQRHRSLCRARLNSHCKF
jgi:hypothetical protein